MKSFGWIRYVLAALLLPLLVGGIRMTSALSRKPPPLVAASSVAPPGIKPHDPSKPTVAILLGDGRGGFALAASSVVGADPNSIAAGDFNADGHVDLVTVNEDSEDCSVLLGHGDGSFGPPSTLTLIFVAPSTTWLLVMM